MSQRKVLANPNDLRMTADVRMEPQTTDVSCRFKFYERQNSKARPFYQ